MKRKAIAFAALVALISFASCKKTYTCSCSSTTTLSTGGTVSTTETYSDIYSSKKDAEAACQSKEDAYNSEANTTATCTSTKN